jgi:hypothetical protein
MAADGASWLAVLGAGLIKLAPAGLGAAMRAVIAPPASRWELLGRAFVAFVFSHLFGDVAAALAAHWIPGFSLANSAHTRAVDGACGALGWFVMGGVAVMAKRFRRDPVKTVRSVRG